jgi:flagellar hook-associated protein 1 FlgK
MGLSTSLGIARSSLFTTAEQTSVISRNIANADTELYSRKTANTITVPGSGVRIVSITRATEPALLRNMLRANSDANAHKVIADALNQLDQTVNDPELDTSPAALISKLADALQQYQVQPQSELAGRAAITAARNLAFALNTATQVVNEVRRDADAGIASDVDRVNSLLERFKTVNEQVIKGELTGADVTDYLDARDQIVNEISEEMGVRTLTRPGNDMALYTDSGVPLFDRDPRPITFDRTLNLAPGISGDPVVIDGVQVTGAGATMGIQSGRIAGYAEIRDDATVVYQRQLDEIARGLIEIFAESDQSAAPSLPDAPGLFTYPGAPAMPVSGVVLDGLAGVISINANVDPDQGGVLTRLRDGGIADPLVSNYIYNTTGAAGFSDRLVELQNNMTQQIPFDGTSQLNPNTTIFDFSSSSVAWLEEARKAAANEFEYRETLYQRSSEALSKATGVNLDEEMTLLLEIERSYQTSSKLISVLDSMFSALVGAIR